MILEDYHVHTAFCDGSGSPEEFAAAAEAMGMKRLGFSAHSYTDYDESCCMEKAKALDYVREIQRLKEKYAGRLEIFCGIEQDYYSAPLNVHLDYSIGSLHSIQISSDTYFLVDYSAEVFADGVQKYFNGDVYAMAERYFALVGDVIRKTNADIIGHFDLITKFNEKMPMIDETDMRYRAAWKKAVDALIPYNKPFEINTGAISRGYRSVPYPSKEILSYIKEKGGSVILSSDSHSPQTLCYQFAEAEKLANSIDLNILTSAR